MFTDKTSLLNCCLVGVTTIFGKVGIGQIEVLFLLRSFLSNSKRPFAQQANVLLDGHVLPGGGPVAALLGYVGHQRSPETAKRG